MIKKATGSSIQDLLNHLNEFEKKADAPPSSAVDGEDPNKKTPQSVSGEIKSDLNENGVKVMPASASAPNNNDTQPSASVGLTSGHPQDVPLPDKTKDTKDDPGTESGLKAAADYSSLSFNELRARFKTAGDGVLATIQVKAASMGLKAPTTGTAPDPAVAAGYAAAQAAGELQKQANAKAALVKVARDALYAATEVHKLIKQAEEEEGGESEPSESKPKAESSAPPSGGGGGPPPGAGGPPPMPGGDPAMMGGGMPPPPGGDPAAMGGGMPGGGMGGPEEKQAAIDLIIQVMDEAQIAPEELLAQLQQGAAPAPAGAPPAAAEEAMKMAAVCNKLRPLVKLAAAQYSTRRTKLAEDASRRSIMKRTLLEIMGKA